MRSLLIANRGEIARRIMGTAKRMGLRTVAVYSDADAQALHVREADAAVRIGEAAPRESYLNIPAIVDAAKHAGANAVHPGYGFLAENADFAQAVIDAGLTWIGPPPAAIRQMGDKVEAKRIARDAGVPTVPGAEPEDQSNDGLIAAAKPIGFPLMIKAAAGGGGRGMRLVRSQGELAVALDAARSEAEHAFGDGRLLLERALEGARHIEVQVFADQHGNVIHLGERDCSVQRRHQKLIEESPSPAVDAVLRETMGAAAVALAKAVHYAGAGTVEFLLDADGNFYFMEMNTRLQVEHPVTEAIAGIDLVEWQLRVAMGERFTRGQSDIRFHGHAIEARLCAEDPTQNFLPQAGRLALWQPAEGVRTDHALHSGAEISPFYDSMIAKVIAHGATRDQARVRLAAALDETIALGLPTNKAFLASVLRDEEFATRGAATDFLARRLSSIKTAETDKVTLAVAAALLARNAAYGEWNSWSNSDHTMRVRFGEIAVALQHSRDEFQARVGDATNSLRVLSVDDAHARILIDGAEEKIAFAIDGDTIHLAHAGHSRTLTETTHAAPARRASAASDGRLVAPMNGRVVAVNARAGEMMEAGKALVVLEAMKMEHALSVPQAARVTAVHVAPGAQVAPGHLLVELEPAS
jgi:geranyl-CoA carboxylase alpha subunit